MRSNKEPISQKMYKNMESLTDSIVTRLSDCEQGFD
jgi:hypothetical protein